MDLDGTQLDGDTGSSVRLYKRLIEGDADGQTPNAYWSARRRDNVAFGVRIYNANSSQEYISEKAEMEFIFQVQGASIGATLLSSVALAITIVSLF